ncbi:hypothetical protein [Rhodoligotrophos defluvii]|uniref:hypothetical protein n=1 Tax=Rhodoligotrophos defluvii TaxID=2561934 RepID=UPI0010C9C338|nr:hypothetical protein [Rhodoligotrophos defluvii]
MPSGFIENFSKDLGEFRKFVDGSVFGIETGVDAIGLLRDQDIARIAGPLRPSDLSYLSNEISEFKRHWSKPAIYLGNSIHDADPNSHLLNQIWNIKQAGLGLADALNLELHNRAPGWIERVNALATELRQHVDRGLVHLEMIGYEAADRYWGEAGGNHFGVEPASHAGPQPSDFNAMH